MASKEAMAAAKKILYEYDIETFKGVEKALAAIIDEEFAGLRRELEVLHQLHKGEEDFKTKVRKIAKEQLGGE